MPGVGPYASTKYALNALTLTARLELAPENIRVGLMLPDLTMTDFSMPADTPEHVATKILEAVETEAAAQFANSIRPQG